MPWGLCGSGASCYRGGDAHPAAYSRTRCGASSWRFDFRSADALAFNQPTGRTFEWTTAKLASRRTKDSRPDGSGPIRQSRRTAVIFETFAFRRSAARQEHLMPNLARRFVAVKNIEQEGS